MPGSARERYFFFLLNRIRQTGSYATPHAPLAHVRVRQEFLSPRNLVQFKFTENSDNVPIVYGPPRLAWQKGFRPPPGVGKYTKTTASSVAEFGQRSRPNFTASHGRGRGAGRVGNPGEVAHRPANNRNYRTRPQTLLRLTFCHQSRGDESISSLLPWPRPAFLPPERPAAGGVWQRA